MGQAPRFESRNDDALTDDDGRGFGVRINAGIVTHWNDQPLQTYDEAECCRDAIQEATGERGNVERVYVVVPGWGAASINQEPSNPQPHERR